MENYTNGFDYSNQKQATSNITEESNKVNLLNEKNSTSKISQKVISNDSNKKDYMDLAEQLSFNCGSIIKHLHLYLNDNNKAHLDSVKYHIDREINRVR